MCCIFSLLFCFPIFRSDFDSGNVKFNSRVCCGSHLKLKMTAVSLYFISIFMFFFLRYSAGCLCVGSETNKYVRQMKNSRMPISPSQKILARMNSVEHSFIASGIFPTNANMFFEINYYNCTRAYCVCVCTLYRLHCVVV